VTGATRAPSCAGFIVAGAGAGLRSLELAPFLAVAARRGACGLSPGHAQFVAALAAVMCGWCWLGAASLGLFFAPVRGGDDRRRKGDAMIRLGRISYVKHGGRFF